MAEPSTFVACDTRCACAIRCGSAQLLVLRTGLELLENLMVLPSDPRAPGLCLKDMAALTCSPNAYVQLHMPHRHVHRRHSRQYSTIEFDHQITMQPLDSRLYLCHIFPLPLHGCMRTSEVFLLLQATMYSMHEVIYCLGTDACASYLHTHLGSAFNTLGSLTCKVHALQWHKWWASAAHCPMQAVKMRMLLLYSMPGSRGPAPCLHGGI